MSKKANMWEVPTLGTGEVVVSIDIVIEQEAQSTLQCEVIGYVH